MTQRRKSVKMVAFFGAFCEAVKAKQTVEDLAETLNMSVASVKQRIAKLKENGVPVTGLAPSRSKRNTDWEALKAQFAAVEEELKKAG